MMKEELQKILRNIKNGNLSLQQGQRDILLLMGVSKSAHCALDRTPESCSVFINTTGKNCEKFCGNYQPTTLEKALGSQ